MLVGKRCATDLCEGGVDLVTEQCTIYLCKGEVDVIRKRCAIYLCEVKQMRLRQLPVRGRGRCGQ